MEHQGRRMNILCLIYFCIICVQYYFVYCKQFLLTSNFYFLQFVFKKHGELKLQNLQDISIGQKDIHKDLFYVLRAIFRLPKPGRKGFGFLQQMSKNSTGPTNLALSRLQSEIGSSKVQTSNSMRFHNILDLASSNGEYDKLIQGNISFCLL